MVQETSTDLVRINARKTDVFDIFNCRYYVGSNPYLDTGALVFDFAVVENRKPLPIEDYITRVGDRYPHLREQNYESYAHLFAQTVSEVGKLDMNLHFHRWSVKPHSKYTKIAVQALHERTIRSVVYLVWDWFEAINQDDDFFWDDQLVTLQNRFRQSVYGGPTVYALLRTAYEKGIPTFYLWDEGLMQYGWGKKHIRGVATTFNCDSHIDSDFTTRKDDCKAFLHTLGFPVPQGEIVYSQKEARQVAKDIGYPVAVKPVVGHKGIGVTADIKDVDELEVAYDRALEAIPENEPARIIVEKSIKGKDFRLLCVNGRFVAATERHPASVVGDGDSTIWELIQKENRKAARLDSPTSPMSKIIVDDAMEHYLEEQRLSLKTVLDKGETVHLRKVANLSAGGMSINATHTIHDDNIILAQDIAQYFRLTCLGIDVITEDLSESWKAGNFAIIEINAAPGVMMHLNPAVGESVDVPSHILETFFKSGLDARIPIMTFNKISVEELQTTIDHILLQHPEWTIGAVCRDAVFVNRSQKVLRDDYNSNIQSLLRHPKLDLLIAEYPEDTLEEDGMFYQGSNLVVLDNPSETEMMLARDVFDGSTVVIKKEKDVSIRRKGLIEDYTLGEDEPFTRVYLKEIGSIL
ncbi:cyanophycin synthetase [Trichormus variabilis ATCC 29413]|uniref:Cyanophycin synthetase n=2 Tax=Anabaena variabilis TaxID=264691 RepID=Q3MGC5_TRIV2|nr:MULTISPECIES: acetate--CoA ligase family protein [Nostocaceae]ABA19961.1 cyanophycin synthetase [Trichormus variabilis ATCC 29413]MBC1213608.1 cyanophycin synthetase [Trichormus variabilis ARAD]MBC1255482.1 cyanophycin synthetase [Trichormus variabilis V5]MBC1266517.1 cyanophycin synthetase [Trichormus variabilis FSR]MBC1302862.1 cyanophycin synthetase [Trichormus variabilis N2B]